jgi:hypothetical protein
MSDGMAVTTNLQEVIGRKASGKETTRKTKSYVGG